MHDTRTIQTTIDELKAIGTEEITWLDDNIIILNIADESNQSNTGSYLKRGNITIKRTYNGLFYAFDKNGIILSAEINKIGLLTNCYGKTLGYVFILNNTEAIKKLEDGSIVKSPAIVIGMLSESNNNSWLDEDAYNFESDDINKEREIEYFICNNIEDERIKDSCADVENSLDFVGDILTFKDHRYRFSSHLMSTVTYRNNKIQSKIYNNIGKFIRIDKR